MVGLGKKGVAKNCFIYKGKLVNVTSQYLFVRDCNNLLSGKSDSIVIEKQIGIKGVNVLACTEVKHPKPEWGD